jgi:hypothetical protein
MNSTSALRVLPKALAGSGTVQSWSETRWSRAMPEAAEIRVIYHQSLLAGCCMA